MFSKLNLYTNDVQKVFCSASIHSNVSNTFKHAVKNLTSIQLEKNIFENKQIKHCVVYQKDNSDPYQTLEQLIDIINPYICIVFANTKQEVEKIYSMLLAKGLEVGMLHKDMETRDRKQMFSKLNNNEFKYLVATDLASRGLDIDGVSEVISFGLPKEDI
ncbi:MAG: DEAD/DEAH box helicase [Mycoplasmoidaceae bacterium]|nr:DEAD/DEAH box helicase [Mycoplasmoidaceae bacterium]